MIDKFDGQYGFLSNFSRYGLTWRDEVWPTSEHAFQAAKCVQEMDRLSILHADTPGQAKRLGKKIYMRHDWEEIKVPIMEEILRAKFASQHMQELLLGTGEDTLVEGNRHHDNIWGDCRCGNFDDEHPQCLKTGTNYLGVLLMKIRGELRARLEGEERPTDVQHPGSQQGEAGLSSP